MTHPVIAERIDAAALSAYRDACDEAARLESLLRRGRIKSTADWRNLATARERRDRLAVAVDRKEA